MDRMNLRRIKDRSQDCQHKNMSKNTKMQGLTDDLVNIVAAGGS